MGNAGEVRRIDRRVPEIWRAVLGWCRRRPRVAAAAAAGAVVLALPVLWALPSGGPEGGADGAGSGDQEVAATADGDAGESGPDTASDSAETDAAPARVDLHPTDAAPRDPQVSFSLVEEPSLPEGAPSDARPSITGGFRSPIRAEEIVEIDGERRLATQVSLRVAGDVRTADVLDEAEAAGLQVAAAVPHAGVYTLRYPEPAGSLDALFQRAASLEALPWVETAFPEALADPRGGHPAAMDSSALWPYRRIGAVDAWRLIERLGIVLRPATAGVVEHSVARDHPDLRPLLQLYPLPSWADPSHGTRVAGIVGSARTGVATHPGAGRLRLRVGPLESCAMTALTLAEVALAAPDAPFEVDPAVAVNMSFGWDPRTYLGRAWSVGSPVPPRVRRTLRACGEALADTIEGIGNVLFVAAASNRPLTPAPDLAVPDGLRLPNLMVVSGRNRAGRRAWFAARGPTVSLSAPAGGVTTTLAAGGLGTSGTGTSFAAPQATGAAALLAAVDSALSAAELKYYLLEGADPPLDAGAEIGGRLDVCRSLRVLLADHDVTGAACTPPASYAVTVQSRSNGRIAAWSDPTPGNPEGRREAVDRDQAHQPRDGGEASLAPGERHELAFRLNASSRRASAFASTRLEAAYRETEAEAAVTYHAGWMVQTGGDTVCNSSEAWLEPGHALTVTYSAPGPGTRVLLEVTGRLEVQSHVGGERYGQGVREGELVGYWSWSRQRLNLRIGLDGSEGIELPIEREAPARVEDATGREVISGGPVTQRRPVVATALVEVGEGDERTLTSPQVNDGRPLTYSGYSYGGEVPWPRDITLTIALSGRLDGETDGRTGTRCGGSDPLATSGRAQGLVDLTVRAYPLPPEHGSR